MKREPYTILIVDDESGMRRVLRKMFTAAGYTTLTAGSGEEAAELLKTHEVDVVLMDLRMPSMSGKTLYHVIASGWPHLATRVIAMSGDIDDPDQRAWIEANDVPVLAKPFELSDAVRLVERLLEWRREVNGS